MISDIDAFFAYPWGRVAFDKCMSSIKSRDAVALTQSTLAVKGFVLAVMVEAVPTLVESGVGCGSEFENEGEKDVEEEGDEDLDRESSLPKLRITPGHARNLNESKNVEVQSIIDNGNETQYEEDWSDDEVDPQVQKLVKLVNDGHLFSKDMFMGGLSKAEIVRLKKEKGEQKMKQKAAKTVVDVIGEDYVAEGNTSTLQDDDLIVANLLAKKLESRFLDVLDNMKQTREKVEDMCFEMREMKNHLLAAVEVRMKAFEASVVEKMECAIRRAVGEGNVIITSDTRKRDGGCFVNPPAMNKEVVSKFACTSTVGGLECCGEPNPSLSSICSPTNPQQTR
ncbi:hypothetical protein AALP_AAs50665U000400 [Arabis alpina]|uniref:DUF1985 domain-containing protein n=1 Tax=Arabis alpina TaxID=50452 RepID=A0A087FX56_ARAAL|nr:hypothetical protein AALP_AAs50665U000400 [Arabis alpina]